MSIFVQVLKESTTIGLSKSIRALEEFSYQELAPGYSLLHWRNDDQVNRDERQLFRQYTTRSPLLDGVLERIARRGSGCEAQFEGVHAKGLLAAFLLDSLATSLPSDPVWQVARLRVCILEMDDIGEIHSTDENILHAATPHHVREHAPLFEARRRRLAASGRDIVEQRGSLLPRLRFCGDVEQALTHMAPSDPGLSWVRGRLFELNDRCAGWAEGEFPHHMLRGSPSRESETVHNNDELRGLRLFTCPDGQKRYFEWHLKYHAHNLRLHYFPKDDERLVLIGYIGPHLRTARY
jgi:hypothetical protein